MLVSPQYKTTTTTCDARSQLALDFGCLIHLKDSALGCCTAFSIFTGTTYFDLLFVHQLSCELTSSTCNHKHITYHVLMSTINSILALDYASALTTSGRDSLEADDDEGSHARLLMKHLHASTLLQANSSSTASGHS
jgi:hypothetical protein